MLWPSPPRCFRQTTLARLNYPRSASNCWLGRAEESGGWNDGQQVSNIFTTFAQCLEGTPIQQWCLSISRSRFNLFS